MKFFAHHPKIVTALIVLYASLFFATSIPLTTSDLGRHIMNGKLVWLTAGSRFIDEQVFAQATQDGVGNGSVAEWKESLRYSVFSSNVYSYTHPDFPVINHHWLFGLIAYGVFLIGGFPLLSLMNIVVVGIAIACMLAAARLRATWSGVWAAAALLLPLVTNRTDVRPESFSLLFCSLVFLVLSRFTSNRLSFLSTLLSIFILQLIWVNTHLFFILGLGILGVFWLESFLGSRKLLRQLTSIGVVSALTSFLNPNGLAGALAPFNIFTNYDFLVAENQSTFFMLRVLPKAEHWYYLAVLLILFAFVILSVRLHRNKNLHLLDLLQQWKQHLLWLTYVAILAVIGSQLNRFYSFFALLSLPPLAMLMSSILPNLLITVKNIYSHTFLLPAASLAAFFLAGALLASGLFIPAITTRTLGVHSRISASADFYTQNAPSGQMYNNYDIGGYLIFHLFPHQRVYTDNRPEAYPPGFFTIAKAAQKDPEVWQEQLSNYSISAVYYYRHDLTDFAQEFLINRVKDTEWAPVFVDDQTLVIYKNTSDHQDTIAEFGLPQEMFGLSEIK